MKKIRANAEQKMGYWWVMAVTTKVTETKWSTITKCAKNAVVSCMHGIIKSIKKMT